MITRIRNTVHLHIAVVLGAALLVLAVNATAAEQWKLVNKGEKRTDVTTYERTVAGSQVKAFRGVTEIHAPLTAPLAVMADAKVCDQWLYQCKTLTLKTDHKAYIRFKGIWPAHDRDALIQSTASQDDHTGAVTIASHAVKGEPKHDGVVRVKALRDQFVFTPLKDGWTRVAFQTFIDPGGNVSSIANTISNNAPTETLKGLRKLATRAPYKDASVGDVSKRYDSLKGMKTSAP